MVVPGVPAQLFHLLPRQIQALYHHGLPYISWPIHYLQILILIGSIDEIFGAMVAGMTSEGGGAVAFPVRPSFDRLSFSLPLNFLQFDF